jgi:hypothetical protein
LLSVCTAAWRSRSWQWPYLGNCSAMSMAVRLGTSARWKAHRWLRPALGDTPVLGQWRRLALSRNGPSLPATDERHVPRTTVVAVVVAVVARVSSSIVLVSVMMTKTYSHCRWALPLVSGGYIVFAFIYSFRSKDVQPVYALSHERWRYRNQGSPSFPFHST